MARRKVICALQLENWQQADDALRQIGEDRRDLAAIENVMNERIADAKADAEAKGRPIKDHIAMLEQALREFAMARAVMSPQSLEAAVLYPARQAELHVSERNILSVHVPTIEADQASLETTVQSYGFAETSAELDGSIATLASVLPKLVRLAEIEKTCDMLADEIEKTRRRVNALEYVMIPQFEMTIREISMKLEENERGATTRLMKVKDMMAKRDA